MNTEQSKRPFVVTWVVVALIYAAVFTAEQILPPTSMLFTVLKKGATYALVAVSMNLLNGFTGIFSLGQAGFMLIGAFVIGISENIIKGLGWTTFSDAFTFALLIVILLVKPTGLFGEKATDKV